MAKTSYQNIPEELKNIYKKNLVSTERFVIPSVKVKKIISRRKLLKGLKQKTLLPEITLLWNTFDNYKKSLWTSAGLESNLTGFKCFVKEYVLRKQNQLEPLLEPSFFHQAKVGKIVMQAPAYNLLLVQDHPQNYWVQKKVKKKKNMYEPVLITEHAQLPFTVYISYASSLYITKEFYKAKLNVFIVSNYQGRDIETYFSLDFDLLSDWKKVNLNVVDVFGKFRYYRVELEFFNVEGVFYFDNFKLYHSGKNWARDSFCNDINQGFTRAYYQVSKHWVADEIQTGADFQSVYYDGDFNLIDENFDFMDNQLPYDLPTIIGELGLDLPQNIPYTLGK